MSQNELHRDLFVCFPVFAKINSETKADGGFH